MAEDAIQVIWIVIDKNVTTLNLEMHEGWGAQWEPVAGASALSVHEPTTKFNVTDLKTSMEYRFRLDLRRPGEQHPVYVYSETGK